MTIWIDGHETAALPADDRGLHYGDGLFETLACFAGRCPWFERHYARLRHGCEVLDLPLPERDLLARETAQAAAGQERAVVKWVLTAGSGGRGYGRPETVVVRRIVMQHPWPRHPRHYWETGIVLHRCHTRLIEPPELAGIKHLNRLPQVLARRELPPDCAEGVLCNAAGELVEGITSNLFAVIEDTLVTPPLTDAGVQGVMRRWVLETATAAGLDTAIEPLRPADLTRAREVFMSNSLIGLWPVRQFEQAAWSPGPVWQRLFETLLQEYPVIDA